VAIRSLDVMDKYPFVISSEKAAKAMFFFGIAKQQESVIVPRLPWSLLSHLIILVPEKLMS